MTASVNSSVDPTAIKRVVKGNTYARGAKIAIPAPISSAYPSIRFIVFFVLRG